MTKHIKEDSCAYLKGWLDELKLNSLVAALIRSTYPYVDESCCNQQLHPHDDERCHPAQQQVTEQNVQDADG